MKRLINIQTELKANKSNVNTYGNYKYRSCEDILEAVKPLLAKNKLALTINDDIVGIGEKVFVKANATLWTEDSQALIGATAYAELSKEPEHMNEAQATGAASSYARKYALSGLFCIDDNKDADATNKHQPKVCQPIKQAVKEIVKEEVKVLKEEVKDVVKEVNKIENLTDVSTNTAPWDNTPKIVLGYILKGFAVTADEKRPFVPKVATLLGTTVPELSAKLATLTQEQCDEVRDQLSR